MPTRAPAGSARVGGGCAAGSTAGMTPSSAAQSPARYEVGVIRLMPSPLAAESNARAAVEGNTCRAAPSHAVVITDAYEPMTRNIQEPAGRSLPCRHGGGEA